MQTEALGFNFQQDSDGSDDQNDIEGYQKVLQTLYKPLPILRCYEKVIVNQTNLEVIQKKVVAFAAQYGSLNDNTTKMVLSYVQNIREVAYEKYKKDQVPISLHLLSKCLGFLTPINSPYSYKMLLIKIDSANKLLHILTTYQKKEDKKAFRVQLDIAFSFVDVFLKQIEKQPQFTRLTEDPNSQLENCYIFAGKVSRRSSKNLQAVSFYQRALKMLQSKCSIAIPPEDVLLHEQSNTLTSLRIKCLYKLSKCYRDEDLEQQKHYEQLALQQSKQHKCQAFLHIGKKIRYFQEKKNFKSVLSKLDNRKKIESEVRRLMEESKYSEKSLYNFFE